MKRARKISPVSEVTSLGSRLAPLPSAQVGWVAGVSPGGGILVDYKGNRSGGLPALSIVEANFVDWHAAADRHQEVVLLFDGGDPLRPIVVGFVAPPPTRLGNALSEGILPELPDIAMVDGKRVSIEGKDEIVLRCGEASITLRRNGKVIIRGTYLDSHSSGTNRVKGASVRIN